MTNNENGTSSQNNTQWDMTRLLEGHSKLEDDPTQKSKTLTIKLSQQLPASVPNRI